jgi:hypothetical protein
MKGAIAAVRQMADCTPLIDWLRVALTRFDNNQPSRLGFEYPSQPTMQQPSDMNLLTAYHWALVKSDLPTLLSQNLVHHGSQHIAASLGHLVAEQRIARQEENTRRTRDATKTPDSYFGGSLVTLLRWHQVATSTQLSKLWKQIANAPKGQHRQVVHMQSTKPSRRWRTVGLDCCFQLRLQRKWSAWSERCTMMMIFLQDCTLFPLAMSQSRRQSSKIARMIISVT